LAVAKTGIARRYAEAVFGIARDKGNFDRWTEELGRIAAAQQDAEMAALLATPAIGMSIKEKMLGQFLAGASPEALNMVRLLLHKGRFSMAPQIAEHYAELLNDLRGIATAEVVSAVPLSRSEVEAVGRRLSTMTGRKVVVKPSVDPSILGGIVARIGDQLIDASVKGRLESLRRQLATA
jgi:F-type H+-transporting ATPase subunit delta